MGGFEMVGSIVGGVLGADAARDAANTQAGATIKAMRISQEAADKARAEILDRMAPALIDFRQGMIDSVGTIMSGESSIMDVLQRSTGQANQLLSNAGADAMQAIMGSRASSQGIPRQTFEQQYSSGALTGGVPPQQIASGITAPQTGGIAGGMTTMPTGQAPVAIQPTGQPVAGAPAVDMSRAQTIAGQGIGQYLPEGGAGWDQISSQVQAGQNEQLRQQALQATGGQIAMPGVAGMATPDTAGTGFAGATEAIQRGLGGGLAALQAGTATGRGDITTGREAALSALTGAESRALERYSPYSAAGQAAIQKEAALSGALGAEAQQQAQAEFTESPGQKYLREQQEKALLRSAAATGGLGGGRVLSALQEQAAGIAAGQQQQYLENLRSIAGRGQEIAGAEAGLISGTGSQAAQVQQQAASNLANLAQQLGVSSADLMRMSASEQATLAERTGMNIANLQQTIQSAQAANQLGLGGALAQVRAGTTADIAGLQQGMAGTGLGVQQNIAQILANLATQQGTNLSNLQQQYGAAQAAGTAAAGNIWSNMAQNIGQSAEAGANRAMSYWGGGGYGSSSPTTYGQSTNLNVTDTSHLY